MNTERTGLNSKFSRRRLLGGSLTAGAAAILAACGIKPNQTPSPSETPKPITTNPAATTEPVKSPTAKPASPTAQPSSIAEVTKAPLTATVPATEVPDTATPKPTVPPTATRVPTAPVTPTQIDKPSPTVAPIGTKELIPSPTALVEQKSVTFSKEVVGDVDKYGFAVHNEEGNTISVVANPEDPEKYLQEIKEVIDTFFPGQKFKFFFYKNPEDVPTPLPGTKLSYDIKVRWDDYGAKEGRNFIINKGETWELHESLPGSKDIKPEDRNKFNRSIMTLILLFMYQKDQPLLKWGSDYAAILKKLSLAPYNTGEFNFPLKVVFAN